ncbi:hypothetical protein [Gelidibacter salicanalis]|uniref:Uncharacterized protein n=1 Tax=Gelidibacter salicanalis TaxID=291193 RepID=A0A934KY44_9FLAO|nr:hypothetical protein [Gelidibacter salicanalis]MBJ7883083.1 hypothetical protein [Gelidibacter salicanalis]
MKNKILTLILIISINSFSQENKKLFQSEFAPFTIQCEKIGRIITDKTTESNLSDWYEGTDSDELVTELIAFESEIDKSDLKITYYLTLINESPLIYIFDFANEETKKSFGQLYIRFINRDNILSDNLKFVTKKEMEEIKTELLIIPPPPPPSPKKKKNGN